MDEAKLQEILDDAAERLSLGRYSNADAAVHTLVAEVRRLTAALATVTAERDEVRSLYDGLRTRYDNLCRTMRERAERDLAEHAAALDAARREGAEGMRAAAVAMIGRRITAWDDDADECGDEDAATRWEEATAIRDAIRALPLDAPGGGS